MIDREKVRKGIAICLSRFHCGEDCPYYNAWKTGCMESLQKDTLELLKEQEAIKPKLVGVNTWECGECGTLLGWEDLSQSGLELISYKYCPGCGRKVKWDADGA